MLMKMYSLRIIAGLSAAGIAAGLQGNIKEPEICSLGPLLRQSEVTCQAPRLKPQTPQPSTAFKVETPELWTSPNDRYERPRKYKLPAGWQGPEHCFTDFCLFSNPHAGDGGMSLITTSRNAFITAHAVLSPSSGVEPTAYYEAEVPGKGIGLIANRTIRKGEVIMQRPPTLLIQSTPHIDLEREPRERLYQAAVDRLPERARRAFLRQMGVTAYDKAEKNSFRMFVDGDRKHSAHLGLFPEVSKFNHDCRPNVHYRVTNLTHTTVAVRDIPPGTELTISYIYTQVPRATRQSQLREWGFECTCSQCTLPALESGASDARIRQIDALEEEIESVMAQPGAPGLRPEMAGKLVELYRAERLDAALGPALTRAALISAMFGREEEARGFAEQAAEAVERETGPGRKDAEAMRGLAKEPRGHWAWGVLVGREEGKRNKTGGI